MNKLLKNRSRIIVVVMTVILLCSSTISSTVVAVTSEKGIKEEKVTISPTTVEPITKDNYKTWTASTLTEGLSVVETLFAQTPNLQKIWTPGSINTLSNIYNLAKKSPKGVAEDLIREQLIQTVQKMDLFVSGGIGTVDFNYRYASNGLEYTNNYKLDVEGYPGEKEKNYDIVFILDWSGSMDKPVGTIKNARTHAKEMIEAMARKILKENGNTSRIRLFAVNHKMNNAEYPESSIQYDTGFFDANDDYEQIITDAYNRRVRYTNDYIPKSIKEVTAIMDQDVRSDAIPVMFVMGDFQFSDSDAVRAEYVDSVVNYKNVMTRKTRETPVYHGIAYVTSTSYYTPEIDNPIFASDNFRYLELKGSDGVTSESAIKQFTDLLEESLGYLSWSSFISSTTLKPVSGSFSSPVGNTVTNQTNDYLAFSGVNIASAMGTYRTQFKKSTPPGPFVKGDTLPYYDQGYVTVAGMQLDYINNPTFFVPVTDVALEIYNYSGVGTMTDPANYIKETTIVSQNYHPFGGNDYDKKSSQLSSIDYGTAVTKKQALDILKESVGNDKFSKYDFTKANNITAPWLTASYDSTKNVYRLYSTNGAGEMKLAQKNLDSKTEENFVGNQIETTITAEYTKQFDASDGIITVQLPKEMEKPTKLWLNDSLVSNIDDYYVEETGTASHGLKIKGAEIKKGTLFEVKYQAEILSTNKEEKLTTLANFKGKSELGAAVDMSGSIDLVVSVNPTVKVVYQDEAGNELKDKDNHVILDKVIVGPLDTEYDVSGSDYLLNLEGYELDKNQLPANTKGKFSYDEIVVKYIYKKINEHLVTKPAYKNQLSFAWAPKSFDLGKRRPVIAGNIFELESPSKDKQWIVINEGRESTDPKFGNKWKVTAKMGVLTSDDQSTIKGAQLLMNLNKVQKYEIGTKMNATGTDIVPQDPNASDAGIITEFPGKLSDIQIGNGVPGMDKQLITLIGDNKTEVDVIAQTVDRTNDFRKQEGFATKISDQRLLIPYIDMGSISETGSKDYKALITWTLARDIN